MCRLALDDVGITQTNEVLYRKELCKTLGSRCVTTLFTSTYRQNDFYGEGFNRAAFEDFIPDFSAQCPELDLTSFPTTEYRIAELGDDQGKELCLSHQRWDPWQDQGDAA